MAEMHLAMSHKSTVCYIADLRLLSALMSGNLASMDLTFNNAMVTQEDGSHDASGTDCSRLAFSLTISFSTSMLFLMVLELKFSICNPVSVLTRLNAT